MEPALAAFDRSRREAAVGLFPRYLSERVEFDLRRDVVRFLLEGVAQQDGITFNRDQRKGALLRFLKLLIGTEEGVALLRKVVEGGAQQDDAA